MDPTLTGSLAVVEGSINFKYEQDRLPTTRPTIVFLHAAVADLSLFDDQVNLLTKRGWKCLRMDLLGFGKSMASDEYLKTDPRSPIDHLQYIESVIDHVVGADAKVILIGLSAGGGLALDFAVTRTQRVAGVVLNAGGIEGFEHPLEPEEESLFQKEEEFRQSGQSDALARLYVRIWGDGPLQPAGRVPKSVSKQLLDWCIDIAQSECAGTGGWNLGAKSLDPPGVKRLQEISEVPVAIAYGEYDENHTTAAMKYISSQLPKSTLKRFETAHMINLEVPDQYNEWLLGWLDSSFPKDTGSG